MYCIKLILDLDHSKPHTINGDNGLTDGEDIDGVGSTTVLTSVTCTGHVALSRVVGSRSTTLPDVVTVALLSVFKTGDPESLGGAERGADFDGHVGSSGRSALQSASGNFLNTSGRGVSTSTGGLVVSVGVHLQSVGTTTGVCRHSRAWGNTLTRGRGEGSSVLECVAAVAFTSVFKTSVLVVSTE